MPGRPHPIPAGERLPLALRLARRRRVAARRCRCTGAIRSGCTGTIGTRTIGTGTIGTRTIGTRSIGTGSVCTGTISTGTISTGQSRPNRFTGASRRAGGADRRVAGELIHQAAGFLLVALDDPQLVVDELLELRRGMVLQHFQLGRHVAMGEQLLTQKRTVKLVALVPFEFLLRSLQAAVRHLLVNGVPVKLPRLTAWAAKGWPTRLTGLSGLSAKRLAGTRRFIVSLTRGAGTNTRTGRILILLGDEHRLTRGKDARLRVVIRRAWSSWPRLVGAGSIRTGSIRTGSIGTGSIGTGPIGTGAIGTGAIQTRAIGAGAIYAGTIRTGPIRSGQSGPRRAGAKSAGRVGVMAHVQALSERSGKLRQPFAAGRVLLDELVGKLLGLLRLQVVLRKLGEFDFVAASRQDERGDLLIGSAGVHRSGEAGLTRLAGLSDAWLAGLTRLTGLSNARPRGLRGRRPWLSADARLQGLSFVLGESGACQAH